MRSDTAPWSLCSRQRKQARNLQRKLLRPTFSSSEAEIPCFFAMVIWNMNFGPDASRKDRRSWDDPEEQRAGPEPQVGAPSAAALYEIPTGVGARQSKEMTAGR